MSPPEGDRRSNELGKSAGIDKKKQKQRIPIYCDGISKILKPEIMLTSVSFLS